MYPILVKLERGQPLRQDEEWYNDAPKNGTFDSLFFDAFYKLGTERNYGMAEGPIPYSRSEEYGLRRGLSVEQATQFADIIYLMDNAYLKYKAEKAKAESEVVKVGQKGRGK